mmetsp:Transcript_35914/g.40980  ORF Transcript_35914/g.40980 Transcript_35914/m.40980 type:complete len:86 (+) Transcript_35914:356-613(+)
MQRHPETGFYQARGSTEQRATHAALEGSHDGAGGDGGSGDFDRFQNDGDAVNGFFAEGTGAQSQLKAGGQGSGYDVAIGVVCHSI